MKKYIFIACIALIVADASGRPMSTTEWMDPNGFAIWKALKPEEKTESAKTMVDQGSSRKPEEKKFLIDKIVACVDKEVADPDYNGSQVALYIPWTGCISKYTAILDNKAQQ